MIVTVIDDAGFGLGGGRGVYGKEVYAELLARTYEFLGHRVHRVVLGQGVAESDNVIQLQGSNTPILRAIRDRVLEEKLAKLIERNNIELMHVNILNPRYVDPIIRVAKKTKTKLIATIHSYAYICPTGWKVTLPELKPCNTKPPSPKCLRCIWSLARKYNKPLTSLAKGLFQQHQLEKLLHASHLVISPSRTLARKIREETGVQPIHIPNPINPKLLEKQPTPPREESVLFIGRLEPEKGAHLLPEIARLIKPVKLYVAGEGSLAQYLKKHQEPNMQVLGYVTHIQKEELFNKAPTIIFPSIWLECYGIVVIEAFTHARPVTAFALGGPKELIEDTKGGLLAKPYDIEELAEKTQQLATSPDKAYKLGLEARKYIEENMNITNYAEKLEQAINQII